jgi:heptosyltransferase III
MQIIARSDARFLIIRRDNIGDLVCTTPLIRALRAQLPKAYLAALVTEYNAAVLAGDPDLDCVYAYTKAKHRRAGESIPQLYLRRLVLLKKLRAERFDYVLLPGGAQPSAVRTARWLGAKNLLLRDGRDTVAGPHEVEQCCHLLSRIGLRYETPPVRMQSPSKEASEIAARVQARWNGSRGPVIGIHISARKVSQRWPAERFAELARRLHPARIVLLWAPGTDDNPLHPGDDRKAEAVSRAASEVPMLPVPTERLEELIAALAQCDSVICSDGGAMHVAAALGKPIVCLFGNSSAERWHPWGVRYELLQAPSRDVRDISVDDVVAAHQRLKGAA